MGTGRKILITAIITVIGGILITLGIISRLRSSVPQNPPGTVGNSSGNLNNGGLFCEYGNKVYFSNPYDNDFLYSMNLDGSNPSLVMNVPAKYINATKNFLYFNQVDSESGTVFGLAGSMHGIYRKKLTGGKEYKCLDKAVCGFATLINDTIYYQYSDEKETSFRSVSTDGKDKQIIEKAYVNPSCVFNNDIYFPDYTNEHMLSVYSTQTGVKSLYLQERVHNPTYSNGYIYYMSVNNNYKLCRFQIGSNNIEELTEDRVDCFNVLGDVVFYQKNDASSPALIRMSGNGSAKTVIASGNYTDIGMTSYYTYFKNFNDKKTLYRVSTSGDTSVSQFTP